VPRQRDEDVVVGEDLSLVTIEVGGPCVASTAAATSPVIVRHRSNEMRASEGAIVRTHFVERDGMLGALKQWRGRFRVHVAIKLYDALGTDIPFRAMSEPPTVVIK
jgi:hypothetical protein